MQVRRLFSSIQRARTVPLAFTEIPSIKDEHFASQAARPLVIMHGLLGSSSNWRTLSAKPELSKNRKVFCVDLRNHGSSPHSTNTSFQDMADDVLRFMDDHSLSCCDVIGHSLGGKVAMVAALTDSSRVGSLVVADIAPVQYPQENNEPMSIGHILDSLLAVDTNSLRSRRDADRFLQDKIPNAGVRAFVMQNLVLEDKESQRWGWRCNLPVLRANLDQWAAFDYEDRRFDGPTKFIGGSNSTYIVPAYHDAIHTMFPNSTIDMIDGAGHWLHAEKPQEFATICGQFLNSSSSVSM